MSDPSDPRSERRSSWLELFFDLVFVSAVAALADQLHAGHSLAGFASSRRCSSRSGAWRGYAWYASGFDTDDAVYCTGMLAAMAAVATLAAGVAGTAHRVSSTFVIAYAGLFDEGMRPVLWVGAMTVDTGSTVAATIWWHCSRWRPMPGNSRPARNAWAQVTS